MAFGLQYSHMTFRMRLILVVMLSYSSVMAAMKEEILNGNIPIRGVNLGGWLVAEHWMTPASPAWKGAESVANKGEYVTMKALGHSRGSVSASLKIGVQRKRDAQFDEHRRTFITESDFREIAAAGMNTVRIPIGYWIVGFDNSGGGDPEGWKVWAPGALRYLDKAIREWAPSNNLLVLISFHAAKGSQNGMDHSSPQNPGSGYWSQYTENVINTLEAVTWLVARYKDERAFLGIGLLNEPTGQDEGVLKQYYYDAYGRIRNDLKSNCLLMISPLLHQQGPGESDWNQFMRYPHFYNLRHEWHKYQVWGFEADKGWDAEKVIGYVNNQLRNNFQAWDGNWIFNGEWSMAASVQMNDEQFRRYGQAQLETFSRSKGGWTFWAWKFYNDDGVNKNGWSMKSMIRNGIITIR